MVLRVIFSLCIHMKRTETLYAFTKMRTSRRLPRRMKSTVAQRQVALDATVLIGVGLENALFWRLRPHGANAGAAGVRHVKALESRGRAEKEHKKTPPRVVAGRRVFGRFRGRCGAGGAQCFPFQVNGLFNSLSRGSRVSFSERRGEMSGQGMFRSGSFQHRPPSASGL